MISTLRKALLITWPLALLSATQGASLDAAGAEPVPEVAFLLSSAQAKPGGTATLVLSVKTNVPLRSLSASIDFDEAKVRVVDPRRLPPPEGEDPLGSPPPAPEDLVSTSWSNVDQEAGNQASEGWLHVELSALNDKGELMLTPEVVVPIYEIEFQVLPDAAMGFTPVLFATVGPVSPFPATFFVNRAEPADRDAAPGFAADVPWGNLQGGGIYIIGEIGFMRGDATFDRRRDISDPIVTLGYLFMAGVDLVCKDAADSNDDGVLDLSDAIYSLLHLFENSAPFPQPDEWGTDPTEDGLGCAIYPGG